MPGSLKRFCGLWPQDLGRALQTLGSDATSPLHPDGVSILDAAACLEPVSPQCGWGPALPTALWEAQGSRPRRSLLNLDGVQILPWINPALYAPFLPMNWLWCAPPPPPMEGQ